MPSTEKIEGTEEAYKHLEVQAKDFERTMKDPKATQAEIMDRNQNFAKNVEEFCGDPQAWPVVKVLHKMLEDYGVINRSNIIIP